MLYRSVFFLDFNKQVNICVNKDIYKLYVNKGIYQL